MNTLVTTVFNPSVSADRIITAPKQIRHWREADSTLFVSSYWVWAPFIIDRQPLPASLREQGLR